MLIHVGLSERELATILAALRQRQNLLYDQPNDEIWLEAIATNGDSFGSLGSGEIDHLCDKLNSQTTHKATTETGKTRTVGYFRAWADHTWDTHFIDIAADTPEDKLEEAVQIAAINLDWIGDLPVFVGLYHSEGAKEELP